MSSKKVYLCGDMLNRGAQLQRAEERDALKKITGCEVYAPQDNKDINDKSNADNSNLAERIVIQDTNGIFWSNIVVAEPLAHAYGSQIELGQIKGMRDISSMVLAITKDKSLSIEEREQKVNELCEKQLERKIYCHNSDIRRVEGLTETGDRRSYGEHAYKYGVVLDITDGAGYRPFNEIVEEISQT